MLELQRVSKHFGGVHALQDVSLRLQRSELVGLIGPNGAGKSTLVNVACGALPVSSGTVCLAGRDVTRLSVDRRFRQGLARTYQGLRLFGGLTVHENLIAGALAQESAGAAVLERAWQLMDSLGLADDHATLPANLAFGKQKLLSIGRALMSRPPVVLLDEPFSGLSDDEIAALSMRLRALAQAGTAVLVIEHNLDALAELVGTLHVLDQGELVASGEPRQVLGLKRVREAYFGGHQRGEVLAVLSATVDSAAGLVPGG